MSVQLLDKTRKIGKLLHNNNSNKVVFNDIALLQSLPNVARLEGRCGGHDNFPVVECFSPFTGQVNGVRFLFGRAGVFIYLIQKKKAYGLAGKARRRIGANQA